MASRHGGELQLASMRLGCRPSQLLDASASLVPWSPRVWALAKFSIRNYPDRSHFRLVQGIAAVHQLDPAYVLAGNGAAELFTWAARDAASAGLNRLLAPGFADYNRALRCWGGCIAEAFFPLTWS